MNDVEVQSICDYLEECLFEPSINWPPEQFAERSYSRWAVSEILDRVRSNPEVPIASTVEVFMVEMTYFAHIRLWHWSVIQNRIFLGIYSWGLALETSINVKNSRRIAFVNVWLGFL